MDMKASDAHAVVIPTTSMLSNDLGEGCSDSLRSQERTAIWDAVASYIQQQLLLHKGVRIPTLGSFDVVPAQKQVGTEIVTIQKPVFRLSRILRDIHNLTDNEDDLSDNKVLAPVKYAKVATDAHVSRCKVEGCILGTMSLLSHCLAKGKSIALVLRDVGVLLIEDRMVQMRFYYDFLEEISGKTNLRMAAFIFPQLLDMVVSRMVPVSSLTRTSRVIIFPEFELEFVPKSQFRHPLKVLRRALGEDMWKKEEDLPPIRQHTKAGLPEVPLPADSSSVTNKQEELHNKAAMNKRTKRQARQLPGIPGAVSGKKLLVSGQSKGKPAAKGQAAKPNQTQAARLQRHKQRQGEKIYPVGSKFNTETNSSMSPEAWMPKELTYEIMTPLPTRDEAAQLLQSRPERFWSVLKDPQYKVLAGYNFTIPHVMPYM
ncbi:coiled-coil domain-containing protein 81-like isoform X1 [Falco naumanni]|uniref:coiled-coil domain-containing protein 81-like isoform X1 n=1 Tax=Falco naumanni TaxID=148594 RepID=UPI001ADE06B7|nr:coiled-coil domain-containing protein 81-like isoform X1 [Falco naumanni]